MGLSLRLLFIFVLLFLSKISISEPVPDIADTASFDNTTANKILSQFSATSHIEQASIQEIRNALTSLTQYQLIAKKCADQSSGQLDDLNKLLGQIPTLQKKAVATTAERKFLENKREQLSNQLSICRLYLLRSQDTVDHLTEQLRILVKTELFYAEPNAFVNIPNLIPSIQSIRQTFNVPYLIQSSGLNFPYMGAILMTTLCLGLILSLKLQSILKRCLGTETASGFYAKTKQALCGTTRRYLPYLLPLTALSIVLSLIVLSLGFWINIALIVYSLLGFVLLQALIQFLFCPPAPAAPFINLPKALAKSIRYRLRLLTVLCLIAYAIQLLIQGQEIPIAVQNVAKTTLITLLTVNLIAVIWLVQKLPRMLYHWPVLRFFIGVLLSILLTTILVAQWCGYHLIAQYLLHGVAITVVAGFVVRTLIRLTSTVLTESFDAEHHWIQKLKHRLGLKYHERLPELLWLRIALYTVIWCGFFLLLLRTWGLAQTSFQLLLNALLNGFEVTGFHIMPLRIVIGILLFIVLSITTRLFRTYIIKHGDPQLTPGNREALASIASYIGFSIAVVIGLLIAGVNFSGIAFIAGALTVGIGFGLQNIVNNFFSGLILLVERPIKPGDRIIVGDTEGYVRRISIRSTHILTLQQSDVIVPNSDLISKQVTNYMLYDVNYKITITIGIAYGSDIALAKRLLLDIANNHPQVVKNRMGQEPEVYFKNFGDSSLEFELWCLITDVNNKGAVRSDLNFAIDSAFKQNGIDIAYPQREITIKNWDPATAQTTKH